MYIIPTDFVSSLAAFYILLHLSYSNVVEVTGLLLYGQYRLNIVCKMCVCEVQHMYNISEVQHVCLCEQVPLCVSLKRVCGMDGRCTSQ